MRTRLIGLGCVVLVASVGCGSESGGVAAPLAEAPSTGGDGAAQPVSLATFEGAFDVATQALTIRSRTSVAGPGATADVVTIPGGTAANDMSMHTLPGTVSFSAGTLTGNVVAVSYYTSSAVSVVTAKIDSISGTGITSNGPWSYGTVTAGATSSAQAWTFSNATTNFSFTGHVEGTNVSTVPTSGLVGYYRGAGTDLSGGGNNATTHGTVSLVSDRFGCPSLAGSYNGSSANYLEVVGHPTLPLGKNPRTASVWMTTSSGNSGGLWNWGNTTQGSGQRFGMLAESNKPYFVGESVDKAGNATLCNSTWHNVVVTFDGTTEATYVDAAYDSGFTTSSLNTVVANLVIGGSSYDHPSPEPFTGTIDQLRIYSRVLTSTEITQLYNEGK